MAGCRYFWSKRVVCLTFGRCRTLKWCLGTFFWAKPDDTLSIKCQLWQLWLLIGPNHLPAFLKPPSKMGVHTAPPLPLKVHSFKKQADSLMMSKNWKFFPLTVYSSFDDHRNFERNGKMWNLHLGIGTRYFSRRSLDFWVFPFTIILLGDFD